MGLIERGFIKVSLHKHIVYQTDGQESYREATALKTEENKF